jgi:single-strand DNA-binding protein
MNQIVIPGRLTADPTVITTGNGKNITKITVANDTGYGQYKNTNFFKCSIFGKTGEFVNNYAKKGREVTVFGELNIKEVTKDDQKKEFIDVTVRDIKLHGKNEEGGQTNQKSNLFDDESIPF